VKRRTENCRVGVIQKHNSAANICRIV